MELEEINRLTRTIIGCAMEVHRNLGPGLLESLYGKALCMELAKGGLRFKKEVVAPVKYKGVKIGGHRTDLLVEDEVVVELKSVERMDPVFGAQVLSYLKITGKRVGLLLNFNCKVLKDGVKRLIL